MGAGAGAAAEGVAAVVGPTNGLVGVVSAAVDERAFGCRVHPAVLGRFWMGIFAAGADDAIAVLSALDGPIHFVPIQLLRSRYQQVQVPWEQEWEYRTVSRNLSADREI